MSDRMTIYDKVTGKLKYIIDGDTIIDVINCNHDFEHGGERGEDTYGGPCTHCGLTLKEIYK